MNPYCELILYAVGMLVGTWVGVELAFWQHRRKQNKEMEKIMGTPPVMSHDVVLRPVGKWRLANLKITDCWHKYRK